MPGASKATDLHAYDIDALPDAEGRCGPVDNRTSDHDHLEPGRLARE